MIMSQEDFFRILRLKPFDYWGREAFFLPTFFTGGGGAVNLTTTLLTPLQGVASVILLTEQHFELLIYKPSV